MIIVLFVAIALLIALLVWAPWDTAEGGDGDDNGVVPEEQSDGENGTDVDIDGDIDLDGDDGDGDGDNQ